MESVREIMTLVMILSVVGYVRLRDSFDEFRSQDIYFAWQKEEDWFFKLGVLTYNIWAFLGHNFGPKLRLYWQRLLRA